MNSKMRVSIVATVHHELGRATADELRWLLGRLQPDVLFLECSPANFAGFQDGSWVSLEAAAVMAHRHKHDVQLVPADMDIPIGLAAKAAADDMFMAVEAQSSRYSQLSAHQDQLTAEDGFAYLNSPGCAEVEFALQQEMRAVVKAIGDPRLAAIHAHWVSLHDQREWAMIHCAQKYAQVNSFTTGVLLVGATHRRQILEKSQSVANEDNRSVIWDIDWYDQIVSYPVHRTDCDT